MDNKDKENKKDYKNDEQLVISAANLLNELDVKELEDVKKKILERKELIEKNSK